MLDLTQLASTSFTLEPGNLYSDRSTMSGDGKYVAFDSTATNFVTPDANGNLPDVYTRAAIVPRIDGVTRTGSASYVGAYVAPPRIKWGANTLHVAGKGFSNDVSVGLGDGVTVLDVQATPTELVVQVDVANGSTGTRNLVVNNNGVYEPSGHASTQVCVGCVSIQRWVTAPDPISEVADPNFVIVLSNNEFTNQTSAPPYFAGTVNPSEFFYLDPNFAPFDTDITLQQTVNGTVTCAGCLHVVNSNGAPRRRLRTRILRCRVRGTRRPLPCAPVSCTPRRAGGPRAAGPRRGRSRSRSASAAA